MDQINQSELLNFYIASSTLQHLASRNDNLSWTELQRNEKTNAYREKLIEDGSRFLHKLLTVENNITEITGSNISINLPCSESKIPYTYYGNIDNMYDYSKVDLYTLNLLFFYDSKNIKTELLTYSRGEYVKITGKVFYIMDSHNKVFASDSREEPYAYSSHYGPYNVYLELFSIEKKEQPKGKEGCFIATAIYSSYDSPEVLVLREFRNQYLLTNLAGKIFVKFYYKTSPYLARQIMKSKACKFFMRTFFLNPLVLTLQIYFKKKTPQTKNPSIDAKNK
jgi:hypothetical protein